MFHNGSVDVHGMHTKPQIHMAHPIHVYTTVNVQQCMVSNVGKTSEQDLRQKSKCITLSIALDNTRTQMVKTRIM